MENSTQSITVLSKEDLQEIKSFLEENLNQEIEKDFIFEIRLSKSLRKFFFENLTPYLSPDTSETARNFVLSLNH